MAKRDVGLLDPGRVVGGHDQGLVAERKQGASPSTEQADHVDALGPGGLGGGQQIRAVPAGRNKDKQIAPTDEAFDLA